MIFSENRYPLFGIMLYWHTCCHRQFPNASQMRACRHDDVPIGGILSGLIGAIDGAAIGQIRGGQIGGISIELLHSGCISPSTHWHLQDASARTLTSAAPQTLTNTAASLITSSRPCMPAPAGPNSVPEQRRTLGQLFRIDFCSLYVLIDRWMAKPY